MNKVRAKFYCTNVEKNEYGENVSFMAQYTDSPEDNTYSKATPSGGLQMTITNENIFGFFEQGKQYYLDITPAT